jgi:RNA polymerase sigma-70 factor (ECF subfamily)
LANGGPNHLNTSPSLLERLRQPERDEMAWQRFVDLYQPWLGNWLRRRVPHDVADDLLQEVMTVVCRRLADFEHNQRPGAFRAWLKAIVTNCLRDFQKKAHPVATGDSDFLALLAELEDPKSDLQQRWDQEHDEYVLSRLLETARQLFSEQDYEAFCRVKLRREAAVDVATSLGIASLAAVYKKVSRVQEWLRQESRGLIGEHFL